MAHMSAVISVQFKMVSMRSKKAHMRSTPSLRNFPHLSNGSNVRLTDDGPLSSFQGRSSSACSDYAEQDAKQTRKDLRLQLI